MTARIIIAAIGIALVCGVAGALAQKCYGDWERGHFGWCENGPQGGWGGDFYAGCPCFGKMRGQQGFAPEGVRPGIRSRMGAWSGGFARFGRDAQGNREFQMGFARHWRVPIPRFGYGRAAQEPMFDRQFNPHKRAWGNDREQMGRFERAREFSRERMEEQQGYPEREMEFEGPRHLPRREMQQPVPPRGFEGPERMFPLRRPGGAGEWDRPFGYDRPPMRMTRPMDIGPGGPADRDSAGRSGTNFVWD